MKAEAKKIVSNVAGKNWEHCLLSPEGSARSYFRIRSQTGSWILVESSKEQNTLFLEKKKDLDKIGIFTPGIILNKGDFLLIEDLGDLTLQSLVQSNHQDNRYHYQTTLQSLLVLGKAKDVLTHWPAFKKKDLLREMNHTYTYFIKGLLKSDLSSAWLTSYNRECEKLCTFLSHLPSLPAHRDYHSKNLIFKNKKLFWLDFQDAGLFPRFYDLVSVVFDSYVYSQVSFQEREKLCGCFLMHVLQNEKKELHVTAKESLVHFDQGTEKNREVFRSDHYQSLLQEMYKTAFQRVFKALGSFAFIYLEKKQKTHLQYISPGLKLLKEISGKINGLPFLKKAVQDITLPSVW